jgi:hypothetical protein
VDCGDELGAVAARHACARAFDQSGRAHALVLHAGEDARVDGGGDGRDGDGEV